MSGLFEASVQCPYCWEPLEVVVDDCDENQQYIEDCQVCCQPISFTVEIDEQQQRHVFAHRDDGMD
ncbi:MAG TPA: CPXCG motif-containing cysteine-rich protein [Gammaproteobacteria bacterium]